MSLVDTYLLFVLAATTATKTSKILWLAPCCFSSLAVSDEIIMRCEIRALSNDKNYNSQNEEGYITTFGKLSDVQFF
jgi:hypothetical protein